MPLKIKRYPKRSSFWYVRGTVAGQYVFESTATTDRSQAEKYAHKREREIYEYVRLGERPPATFAEAVTVYLEKGGDGRFLTQMLDHFGETPLKDIGQTEINEAVALFYPKAKASTINRQFISPFITVARAAIKAELPGAVLRPIERRKEQKPIVTPADDEHIEKLLPHCSEGLQALILLMTYTGLRTGEALRVKADDIADGFVRVNLTKNGEPRLVPLPVQWRMPVNGFGFKSTQGVGRALRKAHKTADLLYLDGHAIGRHGFAARWLREGHSIKGLKEAGGWKTLKIVDQVYGHLEQKRIHETMRSLSQKRAKSVDPKAKTDDKP